VRNTAKWVNKHVLPVRKAAMGGRKRNPVDTQRDFIAPLTMHIGRITQVLVGNSFERAAICF
jgi:hypothetical protein